MKSTVLPLVMRRNSRVGSFTADPKVGFVFWESSVGLGFLPRGKGKFLGIMDFWD